MFKKLASALVAFFALSTIASAQSTYDYNSVATAYLQTTISQTVVFDSTMQAGGTFDFGVLAHNGGGRQNQNDTANVKIEFYSSSNVLLYSQQTNYSNNLPIPTASSGVNSLGQTLSGNPQADPAVPWTTLSISVNNCGGSCATVAYAKVYMYGIDASYWAGDYGPWYRAPTLTLNGGGNLLYNPEFGPYNGIDAQGWSFSPNLGACQGAWGGSNACIVSNTGTPGQNTVGLVANVNGGGPSTTGGTTSGTAGGYNSTLSTTNTAPSTTPAPAPAPSAPTVVSTANGTPTVTSTSSVGQSTTTTTSVRGTSVDVITTTRGTPVVTTSFADVARKDTRNIAVTRTTTTVTRTPLTVVNTYTTPITTTVVTHVPTITTTVTTPQIITTWSDGTTTTAAGTPVTTTTTTYVDTPVVTTSNEVVAITTYPMDIQSSQSSQTASASSVGLGDAIKIARNNPFLVDPLDPRDANWIAPRAAYYSVSSGKYMQGGLSFGRQETVENNTFGVAFDASTTDSHGMLNSQNNSESYAATVYLLSKQDYVWVKSAIGASNGKITGTTSIPQFVLNNSQKATQNLVYGDVAVYSAESFSGFRPFLGAKVITSQVNYSSSGSAIIAPNMPKKNTTEVQPYGGVRWEYDKDIGLEFRATQTRDFKTVGGVKGYIYREIADGVSVSLTVGADKGSHYSNVYGMIGLVVKF